MIVFAVVSTAVFTMPAAVVTFIVGTIIPLLVSIGTKATAPAWIKAYAHLLFSAIGGVLVAATQLDGTAVVSATTLVTIVGTWLIGIATYHGFLKPAQISSTVAAATAKVGIG